jgi:type VI secretion system secreted protein Hcp
MAVDIFLKLDAVTGESRDAKHEKEIDILSWSWGMSQSGTSHMGGGAGGGKVAVQDLHITKFIDRSSPTLALFCCNGKHIAKGTLTVRKAGDNPLEYLKLDLEEIIITSYTTGGSGSEDRLTENVSLNFAKFTHIYTPQNNLTGAAEGKVETKWHIAKNKSE